MWGMLNFRCLCNLLVEMAHKKLRIFGKQIRAKDVFLEIVFEGVL